MSTENFKLNQTLARIVKANTQTSRIIPMLVGEAAIGKSSWAQAFAAQNNTEVFIISVNTLADKADVTATKTEIHDDGTVSQRFFPMNTVKRANDYALEHPDKLVYIFADEINRADSDVTSAIQTMFTERRNGDLELADNIRFIAAGNDQGNVTQLDSASRTRFSLYHVVPDADIFLNVTKGRLNGHIKDVLTKYPHLVLCKPLPGATNDEDVDDDSTNEDARNFSFGEDTDEMQQFTAPRTLEGLSDTLNNLDNNDLNDLLSEDIGRNSNALQQLVYAHIGQTEFAEKLLINLTDSITKYASQSQSAPVNTPDQPEFFGNLMQATTINDMEEIIDSLTPEQRGDLFFYLAYNDNSPERDKYNEKIILDNLLTYNDPDDIFINNKRIPELFMLNSQDLLNVDVIRQTQKVSSQSTLAQKMAMVNGMI